MASDSGVQTGNTKGTVKEKAGYKVEFDWPKVLYQIYIHVLSIYGLILLTRHCHLLTALFAFILILIGALGVTAGAHRLWAHHSYDANKKLKLLLMMAHTLVGQGTIYDWVVSHRIHHKYFGTDKDPYNHNRGLFYSHIVTNIIKKPSNWNELVAEIDTSDLEEDSIVMFQKKYFTWVLYPIFCLLLPINAPAEYWGESILTSMFVVGILRQTIVLHVAWLVNSAMCIWGLQPNDKFPADTNLVFILTKSYWLQYHKLSPWDYQTGEFGKYGSGCTTTFIRIWAAMGWATNLRTISSDGVKKALSVAVDSDVPIEKCLVDAAHLPEFEVPQDHYLNRSSASAL